MTLHLTFDIEDYFEPQELVHPGDWRNYEGQVVINTERILALLRGSGARATFFVVGKVAERHPEIVRRIAAEGHVLGSHGYAHQPTSVLGDLGFEEDLRKSKAVLEKLSGIPVRHFRAMGFSIDSDYARRLRQVASAGYEVDSSILESRLCGALGSGEDVTEVPVTSVRVFGRHVPLGGGFVFRLTPLPVLRVLLRRYARQTRRFVLYVHAWEFNRDQPLRRVRIAQRLAQSPRTFSAESKLRRLIPEFDFAPL